MPWVYLFIAGLLEITWATAMKLSNGFTRPGATAGMVVAMILSFIFLAFALRALPLGISYAVWTGIGAVGTVTIGILFFDEPANPLKIICIGLIVIGVLGLRVISPN